MVGCHMTFEGLPMNGPGAAKHTNEQLFERFQVFSYSIHFLDTKIDTRRNMSTHLIPSLTAGGVVPRQAGPDHPGDPGEGGTLKPIQQGY